MMKLNESTYYYKPKSSRAAERERLDEQLRDKIERLQTEFSCYGYRTLKAQLLRQYELKVNHKRLRRVMRKYNLLRKAKRRFVKTTDSDHGHPVYPNLIKGLEVTGINQAWVADITYIRVLAGFVYLAVILDIFSRRVVGWSLSRRIDRELTLAALRTAVALRKPAAGIIHHSDRGVQYACKEYVAELKACGFKISMSSAGNPYDNAFAESFMKTLKSEEVYLCEYENFTDVVERIPEFIEAVYNRKRVHSGVGYLPPAEFEAILEDKDRKQELGQVTLKLAD